MYLLAFLVLGKSSLAFDTIYAEGQRRYVESLSSYARQFLGLMEKPDVESIEGLSPAISIDQKTTSKNPRSTVGTVTEIYDYIRLLYARIGVPYCPKCGKKIERQTIDQIVDSIMELEEGTKIQVLAPIVRGKKGEYTKVLENFQKEGFLRVKIDGDIYELTDDIDYMKLADAFGVKGYRLTDIKDTEYILRQALSGGDPSLIEAVIDPDQMVTPMVPPGKSIDEGLNGA